MIGKESTSNRCVTLGEVTEILKRRKEEGELGFEQQATLEYAEKIARLDKEKARKLVEELEKLEKVKPETAVKLADLLPTTPEEVRVIFAGERHTLSDGEVKEVLDIVGRYL